MGSRTICMCGFTQTAQNDQNFMICFKCSGEEFATQSAVIRQEFRGEKLDVNTPVSVCTACGWQTLGRGQTDELRKRTATAYRKKHGLLTSALIKFIRNKKGQNQAEFAAFLGVGEASVKRWEAGLVQEKGYDQLIRMKCAKELNPIEARKQWIATLSATGWASVSYVQVAGLVASAMKPNNAPNNNRFMVQKPSHQRDLWCPDEDLEKINLTAENENFALAA